MIVYKLTNQVNGKEYVGVTKKSWCRRWGNHLYRAKHGGPEAIYGAIRKYGKDNFQVVILAECETENELGRLEKKYISELKTMIPNGYNMTEGGDAVWGGNKAHGEKQYFAKLNENMIKIIRDPMNAHMAVPTLLEKFGLPVSDVACNNARVGNTWKHFNSKYLPIQPGHNIDTRKNNKLAFSDVSVIRSLIAIGKTQASIGRFFKVGTSTIQDINKKRTWPSIDRVSLNTFLGST